MQSVMQIVHICIAVLNNSNHQCGVEKPEEKNQTLRENDPSRQSETVSKLSKLSHVFK